MAQYCILIAGRRKQELFESVRIVENVKKAPAQSVKKAPMRMMTFATCK